MLRHQCPTVPKEARHPPGRHNYRARWQVAARRVFLLSKFYLK